MSINISFGGAQIKRPGAYSIVDTANMFPVSAGGFKVLAAIGVPNATNTLAADQVSYFNDPINAKTVIGDSELLDIMNIAWQHGADLICVSPVAQVAADTDWQTAIDRLATEAVDGIMIASTAAAIQAKVDTHCTTMSSIKNRKERRGFYGHASGLAAAAVAALRGSFGELSVMATPAVYYFDASGNKTLKGSHYLAAAYAGIWAGQPSQEPITYKYVKFAGLDKVYDGTEIETLLDAGIAPTEYVINKGYRIVQGITMSSNADLSTVELSVSTTKVEMSKALRTYFEDKYVGKAGTAGIEVTMYNDLVSQLEGFVKKGLITGYEKDSAKVVKSGTSFVLEWEGHPTLPINNFLLTSHLTL